MSDVNWWLLALAFLLGVVQTFTLTVRRVKREVPIYGAVGRGPGVGDADATAKLPKANVEPTDKPPSGAVAAGVAAVSRSVRARAGGAEC